MFTAAQSASKPLSTPILKVIFNEEVSEVRDAIRFVISPEIPTWGDMLYYERIPGGYLVLRTDKSAASYEVDIEILFNAILNDPLQIDHALKDSKNA